MAALAAAASPGWAARPLAYAFKKGSSCRLLENVQGSLAVSGSGLTMNGTFSFSAEGSLYVLDSTPEGLAQMEGTLSRIQGALSFPMAGTMTLDSSREDPPADQRLARAQAQARSWTGKPLRFTVDSRGRILKAWLVNPSAKDPPKEETLLGIASFLYVPLPENSPFPGQEWDPLPAPIPGAAVRMSLDRPGPPEVVFHLGLNLDLAALAGGSGLTAVTPNSEAVQGFLSGLGGQASGSGKASYSSRTGLPQSGTGNLKGTFSFKNPQTPEAPPMTAEFSLAFSRTRPAAPAR